MGLFSKKTSMTIDVEGIKCIHCARKIKDALKRKNVSCNVDIENQKVILKYNEKKISLQEIKDIINELGFNCK